MPDKGWAIRHASSQQDWGQALTLLQSIYVGEGFTQPEAAQRLMSQSVLASQGELLVGADSHDRILGAVLLLSETSELRQIAQAGEAEFRLLGVDRVARGMGIGHDLVRECLLRAKRMGARRMLLSTQPSMRAAHRLYGDLGFKRQTDRDWQTASGGLRWVYSVELDSNESESTPDSGS